MNHEPTPGKPYLWLEPPLPFWNGNPIIVTAMGPDISPSTPRLQNLDSGFWRVQLKDGSDGMAPIADLREIESDVESTIDR